MTTSSPAEKLVGATLNRRFRLVRLLGEGGMGAVYEAESVQGEGKRAVKLLHEEFTRIPEVRDRFLQEVTATKNLVHPNVVPILESAVAEDGSPYLVMELLRGQSLGDKLDGGVIVPVPEAYRITSQILAALSAAHAQRVVHRDLKPDNVFVAVDPGGNEVVKILDFGIAKVMDAAGGMGNKTRTGALIGTPGYMSPEQIKSAKNVDPRSDLWGVATILYQMLTGQLPFEADNDFTRLTAVIVGHPTPITVYAPQLERFTAFFDRALEKDPNKRFQTADEMAQVLTALVRAEAPEVVVNAGGWNPQQESAATLASAATTVMPAVGALLPTGQTPPPMAPVSGSFAVADTDPAGSPRQAAQGAPAPGAVLYAPQPAGGTQMSAERHGPPIPRMPPHVAVVPAPPLPQQQKSGVPVPIVAAIAAVTFLLGILIGFLAGGS
ncbi:serine/threonine-protein kinase [Polyangium sp. 6x1]|uniref:serine/threonine-protein kinase n=1 Tax=Polyangium sp. 6x1 TaxID=3042689 RepID=UPI00248229DA|nr:serine/threonine-protein kinase [Polyangium sp. 6x1]MDI1447207.1 serine/threonine-protein kinase [Polyangium sp. 6x1]